MITYIKISGFKSFHNFEMEFTPFTVIAGTNASGKSNLFDALKLLSRLAEVELKTAFSEQRGNSIELFTQYAEGVYADKMEFEIDMLVNRKIRDNWGGEELLNNTRMKYKLIIKRKLNDFGFEDLFIEHESLDKIGIKADEWLKKFKEAKNLAKVLRSGGSSKPFIKTYKEGDKIGIKIRQDGRQGGKETPADTISQTVLGGINSVDFPHIYAVKEEMKSWKFLQLNPEYLREPTKQEPGIKDSLTSSGKNLAANLFRITKNDEYALVEISRKLNSFIPNFIAVKVEDDKANNQYIIKLTDVDGKQYSSKVLSEGTLRLLALCVLEYDIKHNNLLCYEEPENGVHPFRIKSMLELLKDLTSDLEHDISSLRQVIVNTHSPLIIGETINWKEDKTVSVNYSEIRTNIININGTKYKLELTKILPVEITTNNQLYLNISEQDRKYTIHTVKEFLNSANFNDTISNMEK